MTRTNKKYYLVKKGVAVLATRRQFTFNAGSK